VNVISPFKPITREEAAEILCVSLSTLDNMVASGAMPAPGSIPGSRRRYWHPDVFYSWLDQQLRKEACGDTTQAPAAALQMRKRRGRGSAPQGIADRARARDAARIAELNSGGEQG
jgi:excisionase family DNA binding protein